MRTLRETRASPIRLTTTQTIATATAASSGETDDCSKSVVSPNSSRYEGCSITPPNPGVLDAREALKLIASEIGVKPDVRDLDIADVKTGTKTIRTRFDQKRHGIPIFGAYVSLIQTPDGTVHSIHSTYREDVTLPPKKVPLLTADEATDYAALVVGITNYDETPSSRLFWWPEPNGALRLAWQVWVVSLEPVTSYFVLVDANSAEILLVEDRLVR